MLELTLRGITKRYGRKTAVDQVSYEFSQGVYGLLGESGAGKTTLLRMICGLLEPSQGEIRCLAGSADRMGTQYPRFMGYLPQEFGYYPQFTATRFLLHMASLKAIPKELAPEKVEELLKLVDLEQEQNCRLKTFSEGMLRRLGMAQAMLDNPEILVLDEPARGLDPRERIQFRNIIGELSRNRIILLSTQNVSDVEYIVDEILLMKEGKLIRSGTVEHLAAQARVKVWDCCVRPEETEKYRARYTVSSLRNTDQGVRLRVVAKECPIPGARPVDPDLEDVFLYYFRETTF